MENAQIEIVESEAPEGVERVVKPWTQRVQRGHVCRMESVTRTPRASRVCVRVSLGHVKHRGSVATKSPRSQLFANSDSEDDSEDESSQDEEASQAQHDTSLHSVAEWLLLLHALSSVDARALDRALRELTLLDSRRTAFVGPGGVDERRDTASFVLVLEGSAATLSTVLKLLIQHQDELSAEFKQARATVLTAGTCTSSERDTMTMRLKVHTFKRSAAEIATDFGNLAVALRMLDRYNEKATRPIALDAVDVPVNDYETLKWLGHEFPRDSAVAKLELVCSGDLGSTVQLELVANKLLAADGGVMTPLCLKELALHSPLGADVLRVFCSEIQSSQSVKGLTVRSVLQDYGREPEARARRWQQFAQALFGQQATHKIQRVCVDEWALLPEDVRVVVDAAAGASTKLAISSLDLIFGGVQGGTITPLVELIHAVRGRLPRLADLTVSVSDDPAINDAVALEVIEGFAPTLRSLSLKNVELDSLGSLFSSEAGKRLRLRSLQLQSLFIGDMTSCSQFFELLSVATNPIARNLEELRIGISRRHSLADVRAILSLVKSMLECNPRVLECRIECHCSNRQEKHSLENTLNSLHDQPTVAPLGLESRSAFLSVFRSQIDGSKATKKPRVDPERLLARPHQDGIAHVFAFAASTVTRVVTVRATVRSDSNF